MTNADKNFFKVAQTALADHSEIHAKILRRMMEKESNGGSVTTNWAHVETMQAVAAKLAEISELLGE